MDQETAEQRAHELLVALVRTNPDLLLPDIHNWAGIEPEQRRSLMTEHLATAYKQLLAVYRPQ